MNNYEETIYGLIPKYIRSEQQDGRQKKESKYIHVNDFNRSFRMINLELSTRYRSIFADNVVRDFTQNQYSHRTMGPAAIVKPDPKQPLRCRQHSKALPEGFQSSLFSNQKAVFGIFQFLRLKKFIFYHLSRKSIKI